MPEEKSTPTTPATETDSEYRAPAIEEVVTRDGIEREVAYAGVPGPSQLTN